MSWSCTVAEGVSGFSWTSDAISDLASFEDLTDLPSGLSLVQAGQAFHLFGSLDFGIDGYWPVALKITDVSGDIRFDRLTIYIAPAFSNDSTDPQMVDDDLSLAGFYTALLGGPLLDDGEDDG